MHQGLLNAKRKTEIFLKLQKKLKVRAESRFLHRLNARGESYREEKLCSKKFSFMFQSRSSRRRRSLKGRQLRCSPTSIESMCSGRSSLTEFAWGKLSSTSSTGLDSSWNLENFIQGTRSQWTYLRKPSQLLRRTRKSDLFGRFRGSSEASQQEIKRCLLFSMP